MHTLPQIAPDWHNMGISLIGGESSCPISSQWLAADHGNRNM